MGPRKKLRIVAINIVLFALLFSLVTFNKEVLRPSFNDISFLSPVLGCLPNFLAACIIGLAFVNGALTMRPVRSRSLVISGALLVFAVLTVEELYPMWGASTHYDILDIVASGAGSVLAVAIYELAAAMRKSAWVCASNDS